MNLINTNDHRIKVKYKNKNTLQCIWYIIQTLSQNPKTLQVSTIKKIVSFYMYNQEALGRHCSVYVARVCDWRCMLHVVQSRVCDWRCMLHVVQSYHDDDCSCGMRRVAVRVLSAASTDCTTCHIFLTHVIQS